MKNLFFALMFVAGLTFVACEDCEDCTIEGTGVTEEYCDDNLDDFKDEADANNVDYTCE